MKVFNLTIVLNNQVENIVVENLPQINDILIVNGVEVVVKKIVHINTINDSVNEIGYYTCVCEINDTKRIYIPQVKIFNTADVDKLATQVNDFIYENRHRYEILSIEYNYYACMIKYRHISEIDIKNSIFNEQQRLLKERNTKA